MSLTFDYKFGMFVIPKMFVLHSSKYFFTLAPPNPILKGHILICSKREVKCFGDLLNEEIFDFSLNIQHLSKTMESYCHVNSSTISVQDGEDAGQSIWHFHAHIIPRSKSDLPDNDYIYSKLKTFDEEFIQEYTELQSNIKNQIELKDGIEKLKEFISKLYVY